MMSQTRQRIYLCGPIAEEGQPAKGGFQSANLRLLHLFAKLGFETGTLVYGETSGSALRKTLAYINIFTRLFRDTAFRVPRRSAIHFTPLCKQFLPLEALLCSIAHLRHLGIVVDLRAGTQLRHYETRGPVYRFLFRRMIKSADAVCFEGTIYGQLIESISPETPRYWLPNFIPATAISENGNRRSGEHIRLIYTGQISEAKGVRHAALVTQSLRKKFPETSLALLGVGSREFTNQLSSFAGENIELLGSKNFSALTDELDQSHYFVFLTKFPGEGHSNALTEAMGRGCIPICTDHGFNRDVIGDTGFLVNDRDDIESIVQFIEESWVSNKWQELSARAAHRVKTHFSDEEVSSTVRSAYERVFSKISG